MQDLPQRLVSVPGRAEAGSRPGGRVAFLERKPCGKKVTKETHPAVPGLRPALDSTINKRPVSKLATLKQPENPVCR